MFNLRSMVLEGDLKLGRTMGLLTPKIFYSGWMKSDHPVISIQKSGSPLEARTVVNDSHYVRLAARKLFLRIFKSRPFYLRPHFRIHLVHLTFICALSLDSPLQPLKPSILRSPNLSHWPEAFLFQNCRFRLP